MIDKLSILHNIAKRKVLEISPLNDEESDNENI